MRYLHILEAASTAKAIKDVPAGYSKAGLDGPSSRLKHEFWGVSKMTDVLSLAYSMIEIVFASFDFGQNEVLITVRCYFS